MRADLAQITVVPRRLDAVEHAGGVPDAVPADAEPVTVGRLGPQPRMEALVDQRVFRLEEQLLKEHRRARVCEPAAHGCSDAQDLLLLRLELLRAENALVAELRQLLELRHVLGLRWSLSRRSRLRLTRLLILCGVPILLAPRHPSRDGSRGPGDYSRPRRHADQAWSSAHKWHLPLLLSRRWRGRLREPLGQPRAGCARSRAPRRRRRAWPEQRSGPRRSPTPGARPKSSARAPRPPQRGRPR